MRLLVLLGGFVTGLLGVRVVRSRHQRFLHPDGRSYTGTLEVFGAAGTGSALLDTPARHEVIVRLSKGAGTAKGRADVRGVAVRAGGTDLLFSTVGTGRFLRHVPMPRRSFATVYSTITPYRTATGKIYLEVVPDGPDALVLRSYERDLGRVTVGEPLSAGTDAALAFDPARHSTGDLHPTGVVHGLRALAYPLSQRWRGVEHG